MTLLRADRLRKYVCILAMGKVIPPYSQRQDSASLQSQWMPAALPPEEKRPRIEANHLHLTRAEFRNAWTHRLSWVCA